MELIDYLLIAVLAIICGCLIVNIVIGNWILVPFNVTATLILGIVIYLTYDTD